MARQRNSSNGHLEEAVATLIQAQATLTLTQATLARDMADLKRESDARFGRIETQIAEIIRVLNEHGQLLERLPEAVRQKIGFKPDA
jgi:GTP1/Obg family GTP-binding protein